MYIPIQKNSDFRQKLYARLIKSFLYIKDVEAAEANCALLGDHPDRPRLIAACTACKAASRTSSLAVSNLIRALPRYLSTLDDNPEYYPIGHDKACSQIDEQMLRKAVKKPISLFFGGIGDARNLYATLIETARLETVDSRPPKRKYHVTINDLKAPALARDLVMFYLLDDLAKMIPSGGELETEHCTVIFYLFTASILPPFAARRIQHTIKRVEKALGSDEDLLPWIHINHDSRDAILNSLRYWQKDLKSIYTVGKMVTLSTDYFNAAVAKFVHQMGQAKHSEGCETEIKNFRTTGALWPPASVVKAHEPLLQIDRKGMVGWKNGKEYVCQHWEVNVTLTDEAWTESRRWDWVYGVIGFDPFENMEALYEFTELPLPRNRTSLYEFVAPFFQRVAQSLQKLRNRLTVEMLLGEVSGNLDMLRHQLLDRDQCFPHSYDRIHLSNIPYVLPRGISYMLTNSVTTLVAL